MTNETRKPTEYAFPSGDGRYGGGPTHDYGMTLRDYLATHAMSGMCANHGTYGENNGPCSVADRAYEIADAMLSVRALGTSVKP